MLQRRHIPNAITITRLVLTAACIVCLSFVDFATQTIQPWLTLGLIAFIVAALTDWLDGYLARRWDVVSRFGRVMDPLADKVLVLGTFIVLAGPGWTAHALMVSEPQLINGEVHPPEYAIGGVVASGVQPWMVVVMLTRELLVTGLRSAMESGGTAFGAVTLGKLKMVLQSIAIPCALVSAALIDDPGDFHWLISFNAVLLYLTVAVTVLSAWPYVAAAVRASTRHNPEPPKVTPDG
ncbi:MAG: CDP-alcohol phosphatidyltransferase family protein [Planctomycetota bacterium]